jgi:succinyl-diaminopimelate desuccinylase
MTAHRQSPLTEERGVVLALTQELIRIESHSDAPGREAQIGDFLVDWFGSRNVEAKLQPVVEGRANVIARLPGGDAPSLMLCGHLDTMPAGAMENAFSPRIEGEDAILHGRGACDMKGAVAAMACTLVAIKKSGIPLRGDLVFAGTVDEESGALGAKRLIDEGIVTTYAVVGEPTSLRLAVAHKGSSFIRVTLYGCGAHGSCPEKGINAATYAARIAVALEEDLRPQLAKRTHPLLGSSTVSVGRICGGTKPNIVAETCEIDIDRRILPSESNAVEEIRALVDKICRDVDGLSVAVELLPQSGVVPHGPLETDPASPLAKSVAKACRKLNLDDQPIGVTYWTDGGVLAAAGIETVVIGPGDIGLAHGPNEAVPIKELATAAQLYEKVALQLLG